LIIEEEILEKEREDEKGELLTEENLKEIEFEKMNPLDNFGMNLRSKSNSQASSEGVSSSGSSRSEETIEEKPHSSCLLEEPIDQPLDTLQDLSFITAKQSILSTTNPNFFGVEKAKNVFEVYEEEEEQQRTQIIHSFQQTTTDKTKKPTLSNPQEVKQIVIPRIPVPVRETSPKVKHSPRLTTYNYNNEYNKGINTEDVNPESSSSSSSSLSHSSSSSYSPQNKLNKQPLLPDSSSPQNTPLISNAVQKILQASREGDTQQINQNRKNEIGNEGKINVKVQNQNDKEKDDLIQEKDIDLSTPVLTATAEELYNVVKHTPSPSKIAEALGSKISFGSLTASGSKELIEEEPEPINESIEMLVSSQKPMGKLKKKKKSLFSYAEKQSNTDGINSNATEDETRCPSKDTSVFEDRSTKDSDRMKREESEKFNQKDEKTNAKIFEIKNTYMTNLELSNIMMFTLEDREIYRLPDESSPLPNLRLCKKTKTASSGNLLGPSKTTPSTGELIKMQTQTETETDLVFLDSLILLEKRLKRQFKKDTISRYSTRPKDSFYESI
jgi:hypothetical protein